MEKSLVDHGVQVAGRHMPQIVLAPGGAMLDYGQRRTHEVGPLLAPFFQLT
jgi:hypothetical protein